MNEKIKQLVEKAWAERELITESRSLDEAFTSKFAELVVKECLSQVDKIRDRLEEDNEDQQALGADWAGLAIARHFGVE